MTERSGWWIGGLVAVMVAGLVGIGGYYLGRQPPPELAPSSIPEGGTPTAGPAIRASGRVALVIGNGGYTGLKALPNPPKDAAAMASTLRDLGYRLVTPPGKPKDSAVLNLDQEGLLEAVDALAQAAPGQEIALLYYAGHGFQDGVNSYLVPVDAPKPKQNLELLKSRSVPLDGVIRKIDGKAQLMVAVFDACREIPELDSVMRAGGLSGDGGAYRGLLSVPDRGGIRQEATATGRLIAYAGAAGQLVKDGTGEHSPYTQLLLEQMNAAQRDRKNVDLTAFFPRVAWQFKTRANQSQQPLVEVAAQPGAFYLLPGGPSSGVDLPLLTTGTLVIKSSQPPGVVIYVNGGRLGSAPQELNLPAGQQAVVEARQPGYENYRELVWIQTGRRHELPVALKPTGPIAPPPVTPPVVAPVPAPVVTPPALAPVASVPAVDLKPLQVFRDRLADGSEGPAMVVIPAGEFDMGSPKNEVGRDSDERQHPVSVTAFAIGQYEVTFEEYDRFCAATNREKPKDIWGWGRGRRPVINVNWHDAVAYTQWLSKQTGQKYQLPTEAEWEYAARAGTTTAYWWGKDVGRNRANCGGCNDRWDNTAPVGSFDPNPWKLYDTAGNVWEWTCSAYGKDYGDAEQRCATSNTSGPVAVRGGGWDGLYPVWLRSAYRLGGDPPARFHNHGFRLARSL
ncbi:MAG: SUMF1/EgtB/PvdO family nonheme iron enzyme [Candidatus Competibacter sp.]|nr:SUMF1/EgtB/PvdO family nonheme iron enzyme [Candidatus Competibacter sp.]